MKFLKINNKANMDLGDSEELFHSLGQYAQEQFGFKRPPTLNLISDRDNHTKPLGKTAYYDPEGMTVSIYVDGRHPKDILRSFAHELVHHTQNENGELDVGGYSGAGYAQQNKDLRNMERDAYERGNMCFRDWEDQLKQQKPTIYNERRIYKMSTKKWKNKELSNNLSERFGFRMDLTKLNERKDYEEKNPEQDEIDWKADTARHEEEDKLEEEGSKKDEFKRRDKSKKHPVGHKAGDVGGHYKDYEDDTNESLIQEDSGEDEAWHDWKNEHADDDHIKEIEHHLRALRDDRDHDEKGAEYDHDKYEDEGYDRRDESKKRRTKKTLRRRIKSKK